MTRRPLPLLAVAGLFAAAGCSDDSRSDLLDDATETAVRNFAALQGAEQFEAEGHVLDGGLTCTADVGDGGLENVEVECTGTHLDGQEVVLSGTSAELPGASITELNGSFTATIDGNAVFETDQLGG